MIKSKLYHITRDDFELPLYINIQHRVIKADASNIPMLLWPDGSWCLPANVFMLELYHRGLSRKNRGGTLLTYATNISHLLRYVFYNNINLENLTDNQFSLFIKLLQGEKRTSQPEVSARDSNSVIAIGRNCLDFLATVGRLYQDENFIGPKGQIRAIQREFEINRKGRGWGRGKLIRKYWHHRTFPTPDPLKKRHPINSENVDKIRAIIQSTSGTIFQRKRRYVMLKLLEITGGRRSELVALTCDSIRRASKMSEPMLKLMTAKKRHGKEEFRYIPIAAHDVAYLLDFIEINRRRIIRLTCGQANDDDCLLVSEKSGRGLRPNTITQEIALLSKSAGITEQSCPQMFRHRFITKLFVTLIEQHEFENEDSFRRALLDTEALKQKVQEWTGHSSLESLDVYIHLAFDEFTNYRKTYNSISLKRTVDSFQSTLKQLREELRGGVSPSEVTMKLDKLMVAFNDDVDRNQLAADDIDCIN